MAFALTGLQRCPVRAQLRRVSFGQPIHSKSTPQKPLNSVRVARSLHHSTAIHLSKHAFSSSSVQWQTSRNEHLATAPQPPLKDPSHPSLFYHLFLSPESSTKPVFALSFLESRPPSVRSQTVLGWLPAAAEGGEDESGLNDFDENTLFLQLLHEATKSGLLEDEIWVNGAIQTQSGWMHVFDHRNVPALGRIPDSDDILASVRVEDGKMLIETYQPMPTYRLCTGDGVLQLSDGLLKKLKDVLERVAEEETKSA